MSKFVQKWMYTVRWAICMFDLLSTRATNLLKVTIPAKCERSLAWSYYHTVESCWFIDRCMVDLVRAEGITARYSWLPWLISGAATTTSTSHRVAPEMSNPRGFLGILPCIHTHPWSWEFCCVCMYPWPLLHHKYMVLLYSIFKEFCMMNDYLKCDLKVGFWSICRIVFQGKILQHHSS